MNGHLPRSRVFACAGKVEAPPGWPERDPGPFARRMADRKVDLDAMAARADFDLHPARIGHAPAADHDACDAARTALNHLDVIGPEIENGLSISLGPQSRRTVGEPDLAIG